MDSMIAAILPWYFCPRFLSQCTAGTFLARALSASNFPTTPAACREAQKCCSQPMISDWGIEVVKTRDQCWGKWHACIAVAMNDSAHLFIACFWQRVPEILLYGRGSCQNVTVLAAEDLCVRELIGKVELQLIWLQCPFPAHVIGICTLLCLSRSSSNFQLAGLATPPQQIINSKRLQILSSHCLLQYHTCYACQMNSSYR